MFADVRLEQDKDWPISYKLFINGVDFANTTCSLHVEANSFPEVTVKLNAKAPEFSGIANVEFGSETVKRVATILRAELLKHGDLYDAFMASINSAIDDMTRNKCDSKTEPAEYILKRIIGEV